MQFIRQYKKGFVRFFVLVPLLSILGFVAWFTFEKSQIQLVVLQEIQKGFAPEALIKLTFSKADSQSKLKWKHGHEFEYLGEMYDIVSSKVSNDSIQYECFHDTKESKLNRRWYKFIGKLIFDIDNSKEQGGQKKVMVKLDFFQQNQLPIEIFKVVELSKLNCFYKAISYHHFLLGPVPPPPIV